MNICLILLMPVSIILCVAAFAAPGNMGAEESRLLKECEQALEYRRFAQLAVKGENLEAFGEKTGDREAEDYGVAFHLLGNVESFSKNSSDSLAVKAENRINDLSAEEPSPLLSWLCYAMAAYYYIYDPDFTKALDYALRSMDYARKTNSQDAEIMAAGLLASLYFDKGDEAGIEWAKECERISSKINHRSGQYMTATNLAAYYFRNKDYGRSLSYIDKADSIAADAGMNIERYYLDAFRGELYNAGGDFVKADLYFRKALEAHPEHTPYDRWYANVSYACFLNSRKKYEEAVKYFNIADEIISECRMPGEAPGIYMIMSESLASLGRYDKALDAYKKFSDIYSKRISAESEKEFKRLEAKYRLTELKNQNNLQKLELTEKRNAATKAVAICIVSVIALVALGIVYFLSMRYYKRIVNVNLAALSREKHLRQELSEALRRNKEDEESKELKTRERSNEIYLKLDTLINDEKVYRNPGMSLDLLASMVGTNRTYLSQTIKQKTGMTYSSYINELRMSDAIEQLSSSSSSDIVKTVAASVGFENSSNFYRLFKKKVGVSPAVFRQQATAAGNNEEEHAEQ